MPKNTTIAERIKAAREKGSLSQSQASVAWGFKLHTLQQWERSRFEPRGLYLEKIEAILKAAGV